MTAYSNIFVERFWRSIKYEEVYLHAYDSVGQAKAGIARYIDFYNSAAAFVAGQADPGRVLLRDAAGDQSGSMSGETRVAHRVGRAFVASDARPPPWTTLHQCHTRRAPLIEASSVFEQPEPPLSEHLPIYKASYDLCLYLEEAMYGFSRYHKYTLGSDLRDGARAALKLVVRANARRDWGAVLLELREQLEEKTLNGIIRTLIWPITVKRREVDRHHERIAIRFANPRCARRFLDARDGGAAAPGDRV